jgi:hypothetical protein
VTEHLRAPGFADQIVVLDNATVGFEFCACLKRENEMLMPQAYKLSKVAIARSDRGMIKWHVVILS